MLGIGGKNPLLLRDNTVKAKSLPHPKYLGARKCSTELGGSLLSSNLLDISNHYFVFP